jgi:hypothetical protein
MKNIFLITESEKNRILNLHKKKILLERNLKEDTNDDDWRYDTEKQKEWLLNNGYTEESIKSFIGKRFRMGVVQNEDSAIQEIFNATYYEPITNIEEIEFFNMPKTLDQYFEVLKTYGFEKIDLSDTDKIIFYFGKKSEITTKDDIQKYIAKKLEFGVYTLNDNYFYGNPKTKVISWYEDLNDVVYIGQIEFTNNKTDQSTTFKPVRIATFPLIGTKNSGFMNSIQKQYFKQYILSPEIVTYEEYEDTESLEKEYESIRSWWVKDGKPILERRVDNKVYYIESGLEFTDEKSKMVQPYVVKDIENLENLVKKYFTDEELTKQLQKIEDLKKEAKNLKFYP